MFRTVIVLISAIAMLALGGCGVWRGSKDINTEPPSEGIGSGSGMITGKRGGMVIYQR